MRAQPFAFHSARMALNQGCTGICRATSVFVDFTWSSRCSKLFVTQSLPSGPDVPSQSAHVSAAVSPKRVAAMKASA
ncbi:MULTISPECIES: hypothetical protein [unclassified Corallococcus]|uniref:hypothetical protein n=1 Tax=unclassified Corallococcus TaxID=2685029 RepID=UPI001A8F4FF2|nr:MULTISPECIES: hypothetical protein [unclassified Corallococcus]MBN9687089.1 hypothetical protein [Corallococcus sp. NCSPR001]WAS89082.1 hypothetical protein O0N60_19375 [Corallococcus sp. NCRR]